ncbi:MAG: pyrroline-5-carboxylate reductase [Bacilli bacterium]|jgi:pyrroline-5-carboxylate reductase
MNKKIGFIGCGNMATAMAGGLRQAELVVPENILLYDAAPEAAAQLQEKTGAVVMNSGADVAAQADYLVLAVKPYIYPAVLKEIAGSVKDGAVVIVIAVGISFDDIKNALGKNTRTIRVQPSTPALVGESDTTVCPDDLITKEELDEIITIMNSFGKTEVISEKLMDVVPSIASSSPAYALMLIEAMADGGVLHGFPRDQAIRLAAQSVYGAAKLVLETGEHPAVLKDRICTPGGTTIEAVRTLEDEGFRKAVIAAVDACANKSAGMMKKD